MVAPFLRINAVTRANRDEMMALVRTAITSSAAWIVDVKLFSNMSVCFNIEVPGSHVEQLGKALAATGLRITLDGFDSLTTTPNAEGSQGHEIAGTLQITFIHNEPDLRIDVPQIPG